MLLEWRNSREQSSCVSVRQRLSYDVTLNGRDADCPHTHNSRCPHHPLGLHQIYTHHTQRPPTVRFRFPAGGHYIGPPTATSNTLCNIQTDAALTSLRGPHTDTGMRGEVSSNRRKPLACHWKDFSRSRRQQLKVTLHIIHKCDCMQGFYGNPKVKWPIAPSHHWAGTQPPSEVSLYSEPVSYVITHRSQDLKSLKWVSMQRHQRNFIKNYTILRAHKRVFKQKWSGIWIWISGLIRIRTGMSAGLLTK